MISYGGVTFAEKPNDKNTFGVIMLKRGIGLGYDGVIIAFYSKYAFYVEHRNVIKEYPFMELSEADAFLISPNESPPPTSNTVALS